MISKTILSIVIFVVSGISSGYSQDIFEAIENGDLSAVKNLVRNNTGIINSKDKLGRTPLIKASESKSKDAADIIKYLTKSGADINAKADNGTTPLHALARNGYSECFKLLVSGGADITAVDNRGSILLFIAAASGHKDIVEFLVSKGADVNAADKDGWTSIAQASIQGYTDIVEILIKNGADVNVKDKNYGGPSLYWASSRGHLNIVHLLAAAGAEVNEKTNWGALPLISAISGKHREIAEILIKNGALINEENGSGETAIQKAVENGDNEIVRLLLDKGAVIDKKEKNYGRTLLHIAANKGHTSAIDLLFNMGADINSADNDGYTPLHLASVKGYADVVNYLVNNNARVNLKDSRNNTPLHYANIYGHQKAAGILSARGGKKNSDTEENFGKNPFLAKKLEEREAYVWYLGHCGWAVKTGNSMLIFDYYKPGRSPNEPCLANGHIDPLEIKDLNVYVFVTHSHFDHYNKEILNWKNSVKNIKFIFGWKPKDDVENNPEHYYMSGRDSKRINGLEIFTHTALDAVPGAAFLVKTDGLKIYHSGDHGNLGRELRKPFTDEIEYMSGKEKNIDIAFIGGMYGMSLEPMMFKIKNISSQLTFPQHANDREYLYKKAAEKAQSAGIDSKILSVKNTGDRIYYRKNKNSIDIWQAK